MRKRECEGVVAATRWIAERVVSTARDLWQHVPVLDDRAIERHIIEKVLQVSAEEREELTRCGGRIIEHRLVDFLLVEVVIQLPRTGLNVEATCRAVVPVVLAERLIQKADPAVRRGDREQQAFQRQKRGAQCSRELEVGKRRVIRSEERALIEHGARQPCDRAPFGNSRSRPPNACGAGTRARPPCRLTSLGASQHLTSPAMRTRERSRGYDRNALPARSGATRARRRRSHRKRQAADIPAPASRGRRQRPKRDLPRTCRPAPT